MTTAGDGENYSADLWARITELAELLDKVSARLQEVGAAQAADRAASRRTRHLAIGLAISIVLDVVLTVVVALLTVSALNQSSTLHSAQLANCATSNSIKAKELALWHTLFALSAADNSATGAKESPATKKFLAQFLGDVDTTFTQLNCTEAYPGG
jgi:hypothetical protein